MTSRLIPKLQHHRWSITALAFLISVLPTQAYAEIVIEVTKGADDPLTIAIVPFLWEADELVEADVADLLAQDLGLFGEFRIIPRSDMLSLPAAPDEVLYSEWKLIGAKFLVVGKVRPHGTTGEIEVDAALLDVVNEDQVTRSIIRGSGVDPERVVHALADRLYRDALGVAGVFSTHLAYVSRIEGVERPYSLHIGAVSGGNDTVVFSSADPILSPDWSPDGRRIAYVVIEEDRGSVVYIHDLYSGQRDVVASFPGINSAPSWSPDGTRLAMTLSKDGNTEIYVLHIEGKRFSRMTNNEGIDTEPTWSLDGEHILFTSDRDGGPQLFTLRLRDRELKRVTKRGGYNARGRYINNKEIVYVHRESGENYRVAKLNLETGDHLVISNNALDESPCVSPNGNVVIYASRVGSRDVLAGLTLRGNARFILPTRRGSVREPDWSPAIR